MSQKKSKSFVAAVSILCLILFLSCVKTQAQKRSIAVFIPGIISGSPVYEMLVAGVQEGVDEYKSLNAGKANISPIALSLIEAGTNQAEWAAKLTALTAAGEHELIISSNPSLPDLAAPLTSQFPNQYFIILDAHLSGNTKIATVRYNQREQAYMAGYAAALVSAASSEQMQYAVSGVKIALIAAQEYPAMNNVIFPSFAEGARAAVSEAKAEFRVVGNWYDGAKGADIARSLYKEGVDVILPIAGGAAQGVIASAQELGFYIAWFDDNGFSKAPGHVISSSVMEQKRMAKEQTLAYLKGETVFGTAKTVGVPEGYIRFILDDPLFIKTVDSSIREKLESLYTAIKTGALQLPVSSS